MLITNEITHVSKKPPLVENARLVFLRMLALRSGSGWTCVRSPESFQCLETGCDESATHLWVPVQGDIVVRCAIHSP